MGKIKRVADGEETAIVIPPVVVPVQVELTLHVVLVEIRYIAIAVAIHPELRKISSVPLPIEYPYFKNKASKFLKAVQMI